MKRLGIAFVALGALLLQACGSVGPLTIALAPSQASSGVNRTLQSAADIAIEPDVSNVEYKVFGELSLQRVSGFAFSIAPRTDTKDRLKDVAAALNVPGAAVKESRNTFTIGFQQDTGAGVWLWVDDAGSWWSYFPGTTVNAIVPDPNKAPVLITPNEAIARATRFLIQVGYPLRSFRLTATQSDFAVEVVGNLNLTNIPTNLNFNFTFGTNGVITAASGPLVNVETANGYYLITPDEGVARLKDPKYSSIGLVTRAAIETAKSSPQSASTTDVLTMPITRVEYSLMQSLMTNTTTILLPAYTYYNEQGAVGTVIAMQEKYFSFGDMPVNTDEPAPLNSLGSTSLPAKVTPLTAESAGLLRGLSEKAAVKISRENGWAVRIARRNGEDFLLTTDFSETRVNLTVVQGVVTAISIG